MTEFDIVDAAAIRDGRATDAYFERTEAALEHAGRNPRVVAEVTADQFPDGDFELFAGLKDAVALLEGRDIDVDAIPEGRLFDGGPVMRIEGPYLTFARLETSLLGFLSHASGMATAALDCRVAAPDSQVLSFGARHVHPSMTAAVERSALVGGFDGFSHVAAGDLIGREASGTMPHALSICFGRGEQEAAWRAFNEAVDEAVPRIALCDTYSDEVDETLRAVDALGDRLDGVRLDTTGSRRGDFRHIIREVQWELDVRGHDDVDVYVSGGLGPADLRELRDVVDGFGVGGYVSNADPVDFALDIVAVEGEPAAKRGKLSGAKDVYRTADGVHAVGLADRSGPDGAESLMEPVIRDGEVVADDAFDLAAATERALADAETVGYGTNE
ncbi:nicotinate phosphoribosyltransferase [Halorubrum lacusprofundi]|jgi:nicotinate phosphoribosyltransferase|uniref:Quinolinate phosphoribosyl transferase n=1 Tax=Halorubrum lacusprofundi (strain ATCC 49239 / DSM 5036 / JCM 8891 / ACAM 34) TaxID=416348 RepID=B9LT72_HALLT|nr:nicotinate phosphoribosyltransferase [Halorubrum lacusprofundi]ACM58044.1 Quinolinate phosphoribosyl transferase [Halorubrum lacusprofundi ATCC 49239]MCG1006130.1 nicotinate phosphoribosyltransferase [Halorubrum lacusprofundi]